MTSHVAYSHREEDEHREKKNPWKERASERRGRWPASRRPAATIGAAGTATAARAWDATAGACGRDHLGAAAWAPARRAANTGPLSPGDATAMGSPPARGRRGAGMPGQGRRHGGTGSVRGYRGHRAEACMWGCVAWDAGRGARLATRGLGHG